MKVVVCVSAPGLAGSGRTLKDSGAEGKQEQPRRSCVWQAVAVCSVNISRSYTGKVSRKDGHL